MNKFDEMRSAIEEAKTTLRAADRIAAEMGWLLIGRLRHCNHMDLVRLKKELANYNIHTGKWKS